MSGAASEDGEFDDMPLDEVCEAIIEDDWYPDDIQEVAQALLDAVERGDLDATR